MDIEKAISPPEYVEKSEIHPIGTKERPHFFCSPPKEETCDKQIFKKRLQVGDNLQSPKRQKRIFNSNEVDAEMTQIMHDVFKRHGKRCSEGLYQRATVRRAYLDGLPVMMERELFANHGDGNLLVGRVDIEVAGCVLYELKIGPPNILKDEEQIKTYLRAYDSNNENILIAALVYFSKDGVKLHYVRR